MATRKFIASSDLFSNFQVDISLYEVSTVDEIIKKFVLELKGVLEKNNLSMLVNILNNRKFHIHNYTIEEILISNYDAVFYICDHV